jgi:hypothetical protein
VTVRKSSKRSLMPTVRAHVALAAAGPRPRCSHSSVKSAESSARSRAGVQVALEGGLAADRHGLAVR